MLQERALKICPRCLLPYSYVEKRRIGGREYYYAVHEYYDREKRKKTKRRCYLGPREYVYVSHLHEEFILRGLVDSKRIIKYLHEISSHIKKIYPHLDRNMREEILSLLEKLLNDLRSLD